MRKVAESKKGMCEYLAGMGLYSEYDVTDRPLEAYQLIWTPLVVHQLDKSSQQNGIFNIFRSF